VSNIKFIFNEKLGKSMILEFFSDRIMDNSMEERLLSPEELNSSDLKRSLERVQEAMGDCISWNGGASVFIWNDNCDTVIHGAH
jgi:hypothetical protein